MGVVLAAAGAGWLLTRSVHEPAIDLAEVDRDLAELAQALRADAATELELIPRVAVGIRSLDIVRYRSASDFWRPAFGNQPRKGRR